jgi:uncharacterized protein
MVLSRELLEVIACPLCGKDINYDSAKNLIICTNKKCKKKYKVEDDVPIMI